VMDPALRDLLAVAIEAAWRGGRRTLAYFNTGTPTETKADRTPVTAADREAEAIMRRTIAARSRRTRSSARRRARRRGPRRFAGSSTRSTGPARSSEACRSSARWSASRSTTSPWSA
jgi:hypothetical protein